MPDKTFTVTGVSSPGGSITPSGATTLLAGSSLMVVVHPDPGYRIRSLKVDGVDSGARHAFFIPSLSADHKIVAEFEPIPDSSSSPLPPPPPPPSDQPPAFRPAPVSVVSEDREWFRRGLIAIGIAVLVLYLLFPISCWRINNLLKGVKEEIAAVSKAPVVKTKVREEILTPELTIVDHLEIGTKVEYKKTESGWEASKLRMQAPESPSSSPPSWGARELTSPPRFEFAPTTSSTGSGWLPIPPGTYVVDSGVVTKTTPLKAINGRVGYCYEGDSIVAFMETPSGDYQALCWSPPGPPRENRLQPNEYFWICRQQFKEITRPLPKYSP